MAGIEAASGTEEVRAEASGYGGGTCHPPSARPVPTGIRPELCGQCIGTGVTDVGRGSDRTIDDGREAYRKPRTDGQKVYTFAPSMGLPQFGQARGLHGV